MSAAKQQLTELSAQEKRALLEKMLREKERRKRRFPLSSAQSRMWLLDQLIANRASYNQILPLKIDGRLDVECLKHGIETLVQRHESLRTTFAVDDGKPFQVIGAAPDMPLAIDDLSGLDPEAQQSRLLQLASGERAREFDLGNDLLLRTRLLRLSADTHLLLMTIHHIAFDGWSGGVLMRELMALYDAERSGIPASLPALEIQYADFALWQREWLESVACQQQLDHWQARLSEMPSLILADNRNRPAVQSCAGAMRFRSIPGEAWDAVRLLGQIEAVTPFMILFASFVVLLHRYTNQDDVVVGSPVANRNRSEIEGLVGCFVNNLVLRTDVSGDPGFRELLTRVKECALDAYAHQDLPYELLVKVMKPERDLSRNPLFQVAFVLQDDGSRSIEGDGLHFSVLPIQVETTRLDLECYIIPQADSLRVQLVFNTDLFAASTIERMLGHYERILHAIVSDPEIRIGDIELLSDAERHQLLVDWNAPRSHGDREQTLVDRFCDWAARQPDLIAADFGQASLSYAQLDAETNRFARLLREEGVERGDRVGLCVERGLGLVIGILSIWKAGAAYLPLDPRYPEARLRFMLEDADVKCVLIDAVTRPQIEGVCGTVHLVDLALHKADAYAQGELPDLPGATDLAYMIYTSGSTGQPKGALLEHRGLVNVSREQVRLFGAGPGHRVLQFSSPSFDAATFDLVMALGSGATLVLAEAESIRPGPPLVDTLREQAISILTIPPSALGAMSRTDLPALKVINVAGEACPPQLVSRWCADGRRFFNLYGPTECTIWSTCAECQADGQAPSIGRPIANVPCYVLDRRGRLAPAGVPGELCVGGVGVARGYWGREELNRERFIADPFAEEDDALMYRTGDLVRWSGDGQLQFLGRIDEQVKLRGFRVELGEIEAVLGNHPDVGEAVVVSLEDESGDQRLVAYLVYDGEDAPSVTQVREYTRAHLPVYMVPASWVTLAALPLTPNGKVDRNALPAPEGERQTEQVYVAPTRDTERRLAKIWCEVLGVEQVGVKDNFFDLGGHSLLATQVVSRIRDNLGVDMVLTDLFTRPTLEGLAEQIDIVALVTPVEDDDEAGEREEFKL